MSLARKNFTEDSLSNIIEDGKSCDLKEVEAFAYVYYNIYNNIIYNIRYVWETAVKYVQGTGV